MDGFWESLAQDCLWPGVCAEAAVGKEQSDQKVAVDPLQEHVGIATGHTSIQACVVGPAAPHRDGGCSRLREGETSRRPDARDSCWKEAPLETSCECPRGAEARVTEYG